MPVKRQARVIVTASTFPLREGDSTPRFILDFCRALAQAGASCVAVVPHGPGLPRREKVEGIEVRRFRYAFPGQLEQLSSGSLIANIRRAPWKLVLVPVFSLGQWRELDRAYRELAPDYVIAHWLVPQGVVASLLRRGRHRLILFCHGGDLALLAKLPGGRLLAHWLDKRAFRIFAASPRLTDRLDRDLGIGRAIPLPPGFDPKLFHPAAHPFLRQEILFVGRLVPQKGVEDLLEIMPRILEAAPRARLNIVGAGPLKRKLFALSARLGIEHAVVFHGGLAQKEVAKRMRRARFLVFPSRSAEGFGLVALEAMASGLPVIATRAAELELVEHGRNGLVAEGIENLSRAMGKLLADDRLHARLRKEGISSAHPYSLEQIGRALVKQLGLSSRGSRRSAGYAADRSR